jgi:hypothetical protein
MEIILCLAQSFIASRVSETVQIWLSLIKIALARFFSIPRLILSILVTNKSSQTIFILSPNFCCIIAHHSKSSSSKGSSIEKIG